MCPMQKYLLCHFYKNMDVISLPIIISREGKWYVASCPVLDIATQGATEEEVKENMKDLIKEYLEDHGKRIFHILWTSERM